MPPHCDSKDGPVVRAAALAIATGSVDKVLPYVPAEGEAEVRAAYEKTMAARACGDRAAEVADERFFETVVRIHRAGEGAAFTGLKPAGLCHGAVVYPSRRASSPTMSARRPSSIPWLQSRNSGARDAARGVASPTAPTAASSGPLHDPPCPEDSMYHPAV